MYGPDHWPPPPRALHPSPSKHCFACLHFRELQSPSCRSMTIRYPCARSSGAQSLSAPPSRAPPSPSTRRRPLSPFDDVATPFVVALPPFFVPPFFVALPLFVVALPPPPPPPLLVVSIVVVLASLFCFCTHSWNFRRFSFSNVCSGHVTVRPRFPKTSAEGLNCSNLSLGLGCLRHPLYRNDAT